MTDERAPETVTIVADAYNRAPTATVSSLKSEDSTEQLICKTPLKKPKKKDVKEQSVSSKSVEAGSEKADKVPSASKLVVFLGLGQVVLGALLVGSGAFAVVKGAALARVGAGLWAGCVAVVTGVVGVLAGINDCYGLNGIHGSGPLLTAFLALSLLCLACGNSAAVLAATGLQRDAARSPPQPTDSFQDEMDAWTPVLTNIAILVIAALHCLVCIISIYHLSKRICPCFRPKQAFDHNQFEPGMKTVPPYVVQIDEKKAQDSEKVKGHELCKELEAKLQGETLKKKKEEGEFGSANSRQKLVSHWLGHVQPRRQHGVRKHAPPLLLLPARPAHPASTLGRMPVSVMMPPRYATLPLPPAYAPHPHAHPHAPMYYPVHEPRVRRRRSPREARRERRRREGRGRDSQLTRSLERIHRKRRAERMTEADLKRTYTGLDRTYAEQFIAVCDSSRHAAHDSLTSTTSDSSHDHEHDSS